MKTFLYCEAGFVEKDQWLPNSWVNVECPTPEDIQYLLNQFHVPESFLERYRRYRRTSAYRIRRKLAADYPAYPGTKQGKRYSLHHRSDRHHHQQWIIISVCYHKTELLPDFIRYSRRKELCRTS